jgi:hypothetical protein
MNNKIYNNIVKFISNEIIKISKNYKNYKNIKNIKNIENNKNIIIDEEFIIIDNENNDTESSILQEVLQSEVISFSSEDEDLRNLHGKDKFIKNMMCNTCNIELTNGKKYKCVRVKNCNNKYKYYCLKCGMKKKINFKDKLNVKILYKMNSK